FHMVQPADAEEAVGGALGAGALGAAREAVTDGIGAPAQPLIAAGTFACLAVETAQVFHRTGSVNIRLFTDGGAEEQGDQKAHGTLGPPQWTCARPAWWPVKTTYPPDATNLGTEGDAGAVRADLFGRVVPA